MSILTTKIEEALAGYLQSDLVGVPIYLGHSSADVTSFPRVVVTAKSSGGGLAYAGIDEIEIEISIVTIAGDDGVTPDQIAAINTISDSIRYTLSLPRLPALLSALNPPAIGSDTRPVKGLLVSGLVYEGASEGRDSERALHGILLAFRAWASLS